MNAKAQLAILFSLMSQGDGIYRDAPAFSEMEQSSNIVKEIEGFHLPEVTRLICCSDLLMQEAWAEPYRIISSYVRDSEFDPRAVLDRYKNDELNRYILSFDYLPVIKRLNAFHLYLKKHNEELTREIRSLTGQIKSANSQVDNNASDTEAEHSETQDPGVTASGDQVNVSAVREELERLESNLSQTREKTEKYRDYLKKHKAQFESILIAYQRCNESDRFEAARDSAYEIVEELQVPGAFEYIQAYIRDKILDDEFVELLKNDRFLKKFLEALEEDQLNGYALPVLVNLYRENAIDIEAPTIVSFIGRHVDWLSEYLINLHENTENLLEISDYQALLDIAAEYTIKSDEATALVSYWCLLSDEEWVDLLDRIEEYSQTDVEANLCKFIHGFSGDDARHFLYLITEGVLADKVVLHDLFSELLKQNDPEDHDLIVFYLHELEKLESKASKLQRQIDKLQRQINRQPSETFSAMYSSIQQLEELAASLRYTEGTIDCKLVARQIMDVAVNVREGLSVVGVDPVVTPDDWRLQNTLEFDPEKHSDSGMGFASGKRVQMRTMGFVYVDDEQEQCVHPAAAFVPNEKRGISFEPADDRRNSGGRGTPTSKQQQPKGFYSNIAGRSSGPSKSQKRNGARKRGSHK